MTDFEGFPKIARLNRECVITEKIDGTNAQVWVRQLTDISHEEAIHTPYHFTAELNGITYILMAGSRSRWIRPGDDNFGFASWVAENRNELVKLGPGRHFGEWWGHGIQCGYGLKERRFSLFNVSRWEDPASRPECVGCVPVLYRGLFSTDVVSHAVARLSTFGSVAAPGFMKPEGIIIYHTAQNSLFKVTCEKDDTPKGQAA